MLGYQPSTHSLHRALNARKLHTILICPNNLCIESSRDSSWKAKVVRIAKVARIEKVVRQENRVNNFYTIRWKQKEKEKGENS